LGAAVALAFILSTGTVGFQLATAPPRPSVGEQQPGGQQPAAAGQSAPPASVPAAGQPAPPASAPAPAPVAASLSDRAVQQLRQSGFQVSVLNRASSTRAADCVANSYGDTQDYLAAHPCAELQRVLLNVSDADDTTALIALAWVRMPDAAGAAGLKRILDSAGTGNIRALDNTVQFTGRYYASTIDGTTTANADVRPTSGPLPAPVLNKIAADSLR
jgi:hypothetical protein